MLIVSIVVYLLVSFLACKAIFKKLSIPNYLISFFVFVFSMNILICEILSLFKQLNNQFLYLAIQLILCTIVIFLFFNDKRLNKDDLIPREISFNEKPDFLNLLLVVLICTNLGILFFVGINTPPNNLDSLQTHLTRIYYWLQHGSFQSWPASGIAQIVYPINANIQGLWLFSFGGNEKLFFLVPWFSLIIIGCAIYQIARLLHLPIHQSLVSCLVFMTIPAAILQTYSFQNDLPVTALISVFIYLIFSYRSTKNLAELVIALLVLALALGVKQTAFMVFPMLVLLIIYLLIRKEIKKKHMPYLGLVLIFFVIFSSYKYIQNLVEYHSFFGYSDLVAGQSLSLHGILKKAEYNIPRYIYNSISFDGLNRQQITQLTKIKTSIFKSFSSIFHINLEDEVYLQPGFDPSERFLYANLPALTEDTSWFGPLSILLIVISIVVVVIQKDKRRKEYLLFALLLYCSLFMAIFLQRPGWDPYQGRYFILGLIPLLPLVGVCFPKKGVFKWLCFVLLCFAYAFLSFNILFLNISKPIITARTISNWQNSYIENMPFGTKLQKYEKNKITKYTNQLVNILPQRESIFDSAYYDQLFYSTNSNIPDIEFINSVISPTQPVYLIMTNNPLEFALFGINRSRTLYPITNIDEVEINSLLLIENAKITSLPGFKFFGSNNTFSIYIRENK